MSMDELCRAVEAGDQDGSKNQARQLVEGGVDPLEIVSALTNVMGSVGEKFSRLEIFLPEMMMAGESMAGVIEILAPLLKEKGAGTSRGKIVLGTVKGDLHEIGKNIVKLMLESNFFEVRDIGVNADSVDFIRAAEEMNADVIGASALMSTTLPHQKEIIEILGEKSLRGKYKVVVGGAPTTVEWAKEIGADLYCPEAGSAASMIEDLIK